MKDMALRSCSTFARGLLVDLLCMLFDSQRRGCLVSPSGKAIDRDKIIKLISFGEDMQAVADAFDELVENDVIKVHADGYYYSARMVRDEEIRQERSKAGSKGGSKKQANRVANSKQIPEDEDEDEDEVEDETVFPDCLNTEGFKKSWADWHAYRRESKLKKWAARTCKAQLTKLAKLGEQNATAAIEHSIANGYQGIFEPSGTGSGGGGSSPQARAEVRRADQAKRGYAEDQGLMLP